MDSLSDQKDSLEKILKSIDQKVINQGSGFKDPKVKEQKKKWYQWFWPFGKDQDLPINVIKYFYANNWLKRSIAIAQNPAE